MLHLLNLTKVFSSANLAFSVAKLFLKNAWIETIAQLQWNVYSQSGEDGVIGKTSKEKKESFSSSFNTYRHNFVSHLFMVSVLKSVLKVFFKDTIFKNIGTTDKVYVEFGVEDCMSQCNTRYLRENGWDVKSSLLMDGGHSNPDINLQQVIFWPSNIVTHFQKFGVKVEFDFLSVDTDSYDWFMIEAILEAGYKPRVIATEYNAK